MKRFFAVFSVLLILFLFSVPLFALNVILNIDVYLYFDDGLNKTEKITFWYQDSNHPNGTQTDYTSAGQYNIINLVYTDLDFAGLKAVLTAEGSQLYTGYLVSMMDNGVNVVGQYFADLTPDSNGNYYVPNDTFIYVSVSIDNAPLMSWSPVNINDPVDQSNLGYSSGFNAGVQYQLGQDLARIEYLENQIDSLTNQLSNLSSLDIDQIKRDAFLDGQRSVPEAKQFVEDVVVTSIDGFTGVIKEFFNLNVFGIYIYQIVLIACLLPLFIFILKITMAKHG